MSHSDYEAEVQRVAYHIWVLQHSPAGGPEQFRAEAERLVAKHQPHLVPQSQDREQRSE